MPQQRPPPKRLISSTVRRSRTALKIKALGTEYFDMGRCTACQNSNSICFMLDGYAKCNTCTKKNLSYCDGTFSDAEFDALTAQRNRVNEAARRKGEETRSLLAEVARLSAAAAKAQAEHERLQKEAEDLLNKQKEMVIKEANALDELDHVDPPPIASSTVFVGLDDAQIEEMFELEPGSMAGYEGPIPIDRPPA